MTRGKRNGKPIAALLDLLGRRWALRIVWELRSEAHGFRALQEACGGMAPGSLSARLGELRDAGLVSDGDDGWALTDDGRRLFATLQPLQSWAERWSRRNHKS